MKSIRNILFFLIVAFSLIFADVYIQDFLAQSEGDNIVLTWTSLSEDNVKSYEILRGPDKDNLTTIAQVSAKGANSSYSYTDRSAYKTSSNFYAYGLVIVGRDGSKSSITHTRVDHNVSSVKRTWGSIKALFR